MDLRQLEYFVEIVKEGSLTAAARRCRVAQPSLSQQLRLLEEELGEPLVYRKPRGIEPTAAGLLLLEHAEGLLRQSRLLLESFEKRRETKQGRVIFGIIPTLAPYLLPKLLSPFRKAYPQVDVQVREGKTSALIQQVVDGSIGFAILSDVVPRDLKKWSLHVKELFREPLMLALPHDHAMARSTASPRPEDLGKENIIHLQGGHCLTDRTLKVCRLERLDPRLECDQLETALAMVGAGMGVAVVPEIATAAGSRADVCLRKFSDPVPERTISLMKRRAVTLSKPEEALISLVKRL
ncbi:LysR family transcriptional regulator [Luteolibacter algae]|uniref:LysR family transcriptional regulator n=1 Tax=Luteolibacter algae TaxID=454151 RepID=A0ABW5DCY2_9BACT